MKEANVKTYICTELYSVIPHISEDPDEGLAEKGLAFAQLQRSLRDKYRFNWLVPGEHIEEVRKIYTKATYNKVSPNGYMDMFRFGNAKVSYYSDLDNKDSGKWYVVIPDTNKETPAENSSQSIVIASIGGEIGRQPLACCGCRGCTH